MIILVTGQPRHGKSQYSIKLLLDLIKDNEKREKQGKLARNIYCNIAGVNADNVKTKLPTVQNQDEVFKGQKLWFGHHDECPQGYINPPLGSVFIYDECHKVEWIRETSGTLSTNPTTISMNEHGHQDYIFILITQFPQYIHTHLRGLVEYHYHSKRFNGFKLSKIYKWNEFTLSPRTEKAIKDAYDVEKFYFDKKYQNCYTSASAHDSMALNLPKSLILVVLGMVLFLLLFIWRYLTSPVHDVVSGKEGANMFKAQQDKNAPKTQANITSPTQAQQGTPNTITYTPSGQPQTDGTANATSENTPQKLESERIAQEIELLKLKIEYETLQMQQHLYAKNLTHDYRAIQQDPNLQVRGVISNGTTCKAYNTHGSLMTLSKSDCEWYLQEVGRVHKAQSTQDRALTNYAPSSTIHSQTTTQ